MKPAHQLWNYCSIKHLHRECKKKILETKYKYKQNSMNSDTTYSVNFKIIIFWIGFQLTPLVKGLNETSHEIYLQQ